MGDMTKEDLRDTRDTILEQMRTGFKGVYDRQDKTNGRLLVAEKQGTEHEMKLRNLEREVFNRRHAQRRGSEVSSSRLAITQRDVMIVLGSIGGLWAVLKAVAWLAPILSQGATP